MEVSSWPGWEGGLGQQVPVPYVYMALATSSMPCNFDTTRSGLMSASYMAGEKELCNQGEHAWYRKCLFVFAGHLPTKK
jgi:hypothetical protein